MPHIANATAEPSEDVEVTPEMVEAGLEEMWGYLEPDQERMREGVAVIYRAMERARRESVREAC